jgi:hypothetical protein
MERHHRFALCLLLLCLCIADLARAQGPNLELQTKLLPQASTARPYNAMIEVSGGKPPLQWKVVSGKLPPGITLEPNSGVLNGTPTSPGRYRFTVAVSDASGKKVVHDFTINIENYLVAMFKEGPSLSSNVLSGTIEVKNGSRESYDLTVIIVAINEIGKAFALGYQHFTLSPQAQEVIPYSSSLPNGSYVVHVDAIGKILVRGVIRYASLQTRGSLVVNVNR